MSRHRHCCFCTHRAITGAILDSHSCCLFCFSQRMISSSVVEVRSTYLLFPLCRGRGASLFRFHVLFSSVSFGVRLWLRMLRKVLVTKSLLALKARCDECRGSCLSSQPLMWDCTLGVVCGIVDAGRKCRGFSGGL